MSDTYRAERTLPVEPSTFPVPWLVAGQEDDLGRSPWAPTAVSPAESWDVDLLRDVQRRAVQGPWRRLGGVADYGVVPGSRPGAHRYYFAADRGAPAHEGFCGTVVANTLRLAQAWIWEELRGREILIHRDRRMIAGCA